MVLEAAACRIEGIAQSDVDVLMRLVAAGVAVDHYLLAWNADFDSDVEEVALGVLPVQRLDHDAARRDAAVGLLELCHLLPRLGLHTSEELRVGKEGVSPWRTR